MGMTTPLWCLLPAIAYPYLWSTVAAPLRKKQFGELDNKEPRKRVPEATGAAHRAYSAHLNAFEALTVFVPAVFAAHLAGADTLWSARLATAWVVLRFFHGVMYIANVDKVRSLLFVLALACALGLFYLAARA